MESVIPEPISKPTIKNADANIAPIKPWKTPSITKGAFTNDRVAPINCNA